MKKLFTLLLILLSLQAFSVKITVKVDMTNALDTSEGVYVTGHLTANETGNWDIKRMRGEGNNIYAWDTTWNPEDTLVYYFLTTPIWDNYLDFREIVPEECDSSTMMGWEGDRAFIVPAKDTIIRNVWESCETFSEGTGIRDAYKSGNVQVELYPNPSPGDITLIVPESHYLLSIDVIDISGKFLNVDKSFISAAEVRLNTGELPKGVYFIKVYNNEFSVIRKLIIK